MNIGKNPKIAKALKGNKNALGAVRSPETRAKMAKSKFGNKSRTGMRHTEETKRKIGEANKIKLKGRKNPNHSVWMKTHNFKPMLGKKHSMESRRKMSNSQKKGSDHRWWKGELRQDRKTRLAIRRNRVKVNGGRHSSWEWDTLKAQYNWTCPCCKIAEPKIKLSKDHIIPVCRGGSNNIENIQPLCIKCNTKKHDKHIKY